MKQLLYIIIGYIFLKIGSIYGVTFSDIIIKETYGPKFLEDVKKLKKEVYYVLDYSNKCNVLQFTHKSMNCEQISKNADRVNKIQEVVFKNVRLITRGRVTHPLFKEAEGYGDADYKMVKGHIVKRINEKNFSIMATEYEDALQFIMDFIEDYPAAFSPVPEPQIQTKCVKAVEQEWCFEI